MRLFVFIGSGRKTSAPIDNIQIQSSKPETITVGIDWSFAKPASIIFFACTGCQKNLHKTLVRIALHDEIRF